MSDYKVEDNDGAGFELDDDDDLDSMFEAASAAGSVGVDESEGISSIEHKTDASRTVAPSIKPEVEAAEPDALDPEALMADLDHANAQIQPEEASEPEAEDVRDPAPEAAKTPVSAPVVPVLSKVSLDQQEVARVISVLDTYRELGTEEQAVSIQLITSGAVQSAPEDEIVVRVLNADPFILKTMKSLVDAYEESPVDRAFFVMGLDSKTLHSLGDLVAVFTSEAIAPNIPNLSYSKLVVSGIEAIGEREVSYVRATEQLLSSANLS